MDKITVSRHVLTYVISKLMMVFTGLLRRDCLGDVISSKVAVLHWFINNATLRCTGAEVYHQADPVLYSRSLFVNKKKEFHPAPAIMILSKAVHWFIEMPVQ
jgi:hypothetical protein